MAYSAETLAIDSKDQKAQPIDNSVVVTDTNIQVMGAKSSHNARKESTFKGSTMEELREQEPELYNMMLQGIAVNICSDLKGHQERLKEIMQKERREANG